MTKREAEELIEIEIDGTEKTECTEERLVVLSEFIYYPHTLKLRIKPEFFWGLFFFSTDSVLGNNVLLFYADLMNL